MRRDRRLLAVSWGNVNGSIGFDSGYPEAVVRYRVARHKNIIDYPRLQLNQSRRGPRGGREGVTKGG